MVYDSISVGKARVTAKEVYWIWLEKTVVQLLQNCLFHCEDFRAAVGAGCNVLNFIDCWPIDLFIFDGNEE